MLLKTIFLSLLLILERKNVKEYNYLYFEFFKDVYAYSPQIKFLFFQLFSFSHPHSSTLHKHVHM